MDDAHYNVLIATLKEHKKEIMRELDEIRYKINDIKNEIRRIGEKTKDA